MQFFDSHAHITSNAVYDNMKELLDNAKNAGVTRIANICTDQVTLERGLQLKKKYPWIYNTAATTPHDVEKEGEILFPLMEHHAKNGDLVAVGETGLDYFYEHSDRELQKFFFKKYLALALECQLPVVIHCRDAFEDFFKIIDEEYQNNGVHALGVLHCFTGTIAEAREVLARGWYLSLSGIVTFKRSTELREVAKIVPLDQLLIETDTPYLAPQSYRGKPNQPAYLTETAEVISKEKGLSLDELATATTANACKFFNIPLTDRVGT